ncbi:hypothetical protein N7493_009733 [Penicillium malachiteum]|uniref:Uncharacterized protein n=1 Tax=Penicillium malachiteum TaxID=1324776 RepID=A0AAD6HEP8_9EURO|nr:hypothetical protein N7493_009733 [Penicillium malachiteum]
MAWFPLEVDDENITWTFDIVGLLAVVGGSAIEKYARVITASPLGNIPRLLPAPETMLNTDRPKRLPSVKDVHVYGVYNGCKVPELNFFADVIHRVDDMKAFQFKHLRITHKTSSPKDLENNQQGQAARNPSNDAIISLKSFHLLDLVTYLSIAMTIALFIWAGFQHDAVAFLGLGTMSLSTSLACMSAQWRPRLPVRTVRGKVPKGDVVIKTRTGAFIVVKCPEEVSRELYTGTEECEYVYDGRVYQCLLGASTICLMAAIIFFSNCSWKIQIAVGLAYIILNFMYWVLALLESPERMWNMKARYEIKSIESVRKENYTQVLWKAIQVAEEVNWIKKTDVIPGTKQWEGWLAEAKANLVNEQWDAEKARDRWMNIEESEIKNELQKLELEAMDLEH